MRLIDADKLKKEVLRWMPSDPCGIAEKEHPIETDIVVSLMMEIEEAPTIEQSTWILCEERLPEEEGHYLVTFGAFAGTINGEKVIFGDIDGSVSEIGYGCYERDIFWHPTAFGWYDLATATPFDKRAIIAWMPLPKPWKGADDEDA